jgi:signal transduction histidine kinase
LNGPDSEEARVLLDATRVGMEQYTRRINYLDRDGVLLYTTEDELLNQLGSDRSDVIYYTQVMERNEPILTGLFATINDQNGVSIAVPIAGSSGSDFNGVLAAVIPVQSLTNSISTRLPQADDHVFIVASDGMIIGHEDQSVIGKNVSNEFVATQNDIVSRNLQFMAEARSGNFEYTASDGQRRMAAYSPIAFSGNHVWSVLITAPISQSETFVSILDDQRTLTLIAIILIATIAVIFIIFILTLNKRLHKTVRVQDKQIRNQLDDLQVAYERLTEQDKIKDEFINIAAHELRTPVLPIILSAEGLAEELDTNNSKIEIIIRNAKRINKLTNDILDVSRISSNTFRLQKEKVNIKNLTEESIQDALFKLADSKNSNVKIALDSKLPVGKEEIIADKGRLNQVFLNLLDNAINFTDQGTIMLTLQLVKDFVEVRVADTGRGIDPSIRPKLFEKFVTKSDKAKGTGLGLYLCKAIIESHGGTIWAEDNMETGKGAVFVFRLPT